MMAAHDCNPPEARSARNGDRNLVALVSATGFANLADGIIRIGLPLIAARMSSDPVAIGALVACFSAPWLVTSLHVGVMVDRLDRRLLLCAAHLARLVTAALLLATFSFGAGSLVFLYPAAVILGVAEVVAMTCETAIVPMAVPQSRLPRTNAWITALETLGSESIGPALGGLLFAAGTGAMLLVATLTFLLGLVGTAVLRGDYRPRRGRSAQTMTAEGTAGLRYLLGRTDLVYMTLLVGVVAACWSAWRTLIVLFAVDPGPMHLSPRDYGVLVAMLGIGGVAGAILAAPITRLLGRRWAMFTNVVGTTAMLGVPLATHDSALVGGAIFLAGFGSSVWSINSRAIVQVTVPVEMIGRFYSTYRMISWSCLPVGAMVAGLVGKSVGLGAAFAAMTVVSALQIIPFTMRFHPASEKRS